MASALSRRFRLVELTRGDATAEFAADVAAGLTSAPKRLPCRYIRDELTRFGS